MLDFPMFFVCLLSISNAILPQRHGCPNVFGWELCCGSKLVNKKRHDLKCCGTKAYNPRYFMCCDGQTTTKSQVNPQCCSATPYGKPLKVCCCCRPNRYVGLFSRCCGKLVFNATRYMCCNNQIKLRSKCKINV